MNSRGLNLVSDIYWYLILLSGILYSWFLILAAGKILPAMTMQVIFLLDALKFDNSIVGLVTSRLFLVNVVPGMLLLVLMVKYVKVMVGSVGNWLITQRAINNLAIEGVGVNYIWFRSKELAIFTAGFVRPRVYISSAVFGVHTQEEVRVMIEHEINHKNNHHPVKIWIANFVRSILLPIPGKNWLIDNYLTLVEVASDRFAEEKVNNKRPLVSALLKFQSQYFAPGVSYFNSQSERIKILVGQKRQQLRIPMAYYSLLLVMIFTGTVLVKNTNMFYDCQHLLECVKLLITPDSQPLVTLVNPVSNVFLTSDHCL